MNAKQLKTILADETLSKEFKDRAVLKFKKTVKLERRRAAAAEKKERIALEAKWRSGEGGHAVAKFTIDAKELEELGLGAAPKFPAAHVLTCSFCRCEVDPRQATYGVTQPEIGKEEAIVADGKGGKTLREDWRFASRRVTSCPSCVLNITPITDADNNIIRQGIKFPDFD